MLMPAFRPADWYWAGTPVGYSSPLVYGSARGALVADPAMDAAYLAAREDNRTAPWPNDATGAQTTAALDAVLTSYGLPPTGLTPPSAAQLLAYVNARIAALLAVPRSYGPLGGAGAPTVKADCTTATGADLAALNAWGAANPSATQPWVDDFGVATTITGAQAVALASAANAYARSVWAEGAAACTGVTGGAITTTAQIDALNWPT